GPRDDMIEMGIFWSARDKAQHEKQPWFEGSGMGCIGKKTPRPEYTSGPNPIHWAAVHNQFFAIAVVPATNSIGAQFTAHRIDLATPTAEQIAADSKVIRTPHA